MDLLMVVVESLIDGSILSILGIYELSHQSFMYEDISEYNLGNEYRIAIYDAELNIPKFQFYKAIYPGE